MLRFSHYSILSDRLADGGYILMNGISGALDFVSQSLGDQLKDALWSERPDDANHVIEGLGQGTLDDFIERGHITTKSFGEERQIVVEIAAAMYERHAKQPHFIFVPNLDCNYRCTYCFERPMQKSIRSTTAEVSHKKNNVVMMVENVPLIFDSIESLRRDAGLYIGGQIILYGGEPLDKNNAEVVRAIVDTGIRRGFHFAAITNGHDLDHYLDLVGSGKIEQVQISIDGPRDIHDKRRIYLGKESSFDKIVANIDRAIAQTDAQIQIRVHVDPKNIHVFEEILQFFTQKQWVNNKQVIIYANTVYEKTRDGHVTVGLEHSDISRQMNHLVRRFNNVYASAPEVHAMRAVEPAFERGDRFSLKSTYCSANAGNYIFAADGKIYACWESVGKACSRIGSHGPSIKEGFQLDQLAAKKWFGRSIATLPECQECAYALVCGGGCAQYAEYDTGSLYRPYCDDFQSVFRSALRNSAETYLDDATERKEDLPACVVDQ